jgi:hypothetical protein
VKTASKFGRKQSPSGSFQKVSDTAGAATDTLRCQTGGRGMFLDKIWYYRDVAIFGLKGVLILSIKNSNFLRKGFLGNIV